MAGYRDNRSMSPDKSPKDNEKGGENDGSTLYISNLHRYAGTNELKETFSQYGEIAECRIIKNPTTRESRGFGFVTYERPEDAQKALDNKECLAIEGRQLAVELAKRRAPHPSTPGVYMGPTSTKYESRYRDSYDRRRRYSPDRSRYRRHSSESQKGRYRSRERSRRSYPRKNERYERRGGRHDRSSSRRNRSRS